VPARGRLRVRSRALARAGRSRKNSYVDRSAPRTQDTKRLVSPADRKTLSPGRDLGRSKRKAPAVRRERKRDYAGALRCSTVFSEPGFRTPMLNASEIDVRPTKTECSKISCKSVLCASAYSRHAPKPAHGRPLCFCRLPRVPSANGGPSWTSYPPIEEAITVYAASRRLSSRILPHFLKIGCRGLKT